MTRELLDEVLAHPDDDGPRRVYADWLSERGDPRGELIAVQCELVRRDAKDRRRPELEARELELFREHAARWVSELGLEPTVTASRSTGPIEVVRGPTVMFVRGFPEAVKVPAAQLAASRLGDAPIRRLVVTDIQDVDLAQLPAIATLRALRLRNGRLDTRQLARAPIVSGIEELVLHSVYSDDIRGLVAATLPTLRALRIDDARISNLAALSRASWLPMLRVFSLVGYHHHMLPELLLAKTWRDLERLELGCTLPDVDVASVASSHLARGLEHLEMAVAYPGIGEATIEAFSRSKRLGKLQRLVLKGRSRDSDLTPLEKRWGPKLVVTS